MKSFSLLRYFTPIIFVQDSNSKECLSWFETLSLSPPPSSFYLHMNSTCCSTRYLYGSLWSRNKAGGTTSNTVKGLVKRVLNLFVLSVNCLLFHLKLGVVFGDLNLLCGYVERREEMKLAKAGKDVIWNSFDCPTNCSRTQTQYKAKSIALFSKVGQVNSSVHKFGRVIKASCKLDMRCIDIDCVLWLLSRIKRFALNVSCCCCFYRCCSMMIWMSNRQFELDC